MDKVAIPKDPDSSSAADSNAEGIFNYNLLYSFVALDTSQRVS